MVPSAPAPREGIEGVFKSAVDINDDVDVPGGG
jgi:hypothetical protein